MLRCDRTVIFLHRPALWRIQLLSAMAIAKDLLLNDLEYTIWANQILVEIAAGLSEEQLQCDLPGSHGNIVRTLRHIYDAEHAWVHNLISNSLPSIDQLEAAGRADQARPAPEFEPLRQSWPQVWKEARQWLAALAEAELDQKLHWRLRGGAALLLPRWKILRHMVNHATLHRAEIVTMLRCLGKRPPNLDLLTYYQIEIGL